MHDGGGYVRCTGIPERRVVFLMATQVSVSKGDTVLIDMVTNLTEPKEDLAKKRKVLDVDKNNYIEVTEGWYSQTRVVRVVERGKSK